MKIKDIFREFDASRVDIGKDISSDFQKGVDKVDQFINPKRWFGSKEKTSSVTTGVKQSLKSYEIVDAMSAAISGKLYLNDVKILKQILANIKNGTYKTDDPGTIEISIKTAMNNGTLTKEQVSALTNFAKTFN